MPEPLSKRISFATTAIVISDLHLGCTHCRYRELAAFLGHISQPTTLIFNGDTLDHSGERLCDEGNEILDLILDLPMISPLFIVGNHDEKSPVFERLQIQAYRQVTLADSSLLVCHGNDFQLIRGHHRLFLFLFRHLHRLRVWMGAPAVHVAEYAKHWSVFYRTLRTIVRENAVDYALQERVRAIACGHIHHAEDTTVKGVRYLNTGCWTEPAPRYLLVQDGQIELKVWEQ